MVIRFNWREWWKAERFGVIYATGLCLLVIAAGIFFGLTESNWDCAIIGGSMLAWVLFYCAGWHLFVGAVARMRAKMGWITYYPLEPEAQRTAEPHASTLEAVEAHSPASRAPPPCA